MDTLLQDLRIAVRTLAKRPGQIAVALLTLGLGIGANTAMFSIVHAVLIRSLPYPDADRIVRIFETPPSNPGELRSVAHPTLDDWDTGLRSFSHVALFGPTSLDLATDDRPEQLSGASVSGKFFDVMGVAPRLGRAFVPAELVPGGPRAIVLSDALWRRRFDANAAAVGKTIQLGSDVFTIVGVMPADFTYPGKAEFWTSTAIDGEYSARSARHLSGIGRLVAGTTIADARAELLGVEQRLAERFPANYKGYGIAMMPLRDRMVGSIERALLVLLAAVGAILLIACINVTHLALARAAGQQRDFAARRALGASPRRVVQQLVVESGVLWDPLESTCRHASLSIL